MTNKFSVKAKTNAFLNTQLVLSNSEQYRKTLEGEGG